MNKIMPLALCAGSLLLLASPASAVVGCSTSDISPTATVCDGRYSGNILNAANLSTINTAIAGLGYTGAALTNATFGSVPFMTNLNGQQTIDFAGLYTGLTIVGVHVGNGQNPAGVGNTTSFYAFDAGTGLDSFKLNLLASSNVYLFQTGTAAVPELASWAMMVVGFGLAGLTLRQGRSNRKVTFA